jgi:hypothetical protein
MTTQEIKNELGIVEEYDSNGNLTYYSSGDGSYSKRTYDEKGNIIFDEGIGNKSFKPYWNKWDRYYSKEGFLQETHFSDSTGYWYEERYNKNGRIIDHVNSYLAKSKDVKFKGEEYIYGNFIPC